MILKDKLLTLISNVILVTKERRTLSLKIVLIKGNTKQDSKKIIQWISPIKLLRKWILLLINLFKGFYYLKDNKLKIILLHKKHKTKIKIKVAHFPIQLIMK